jgi:hypothetical protein
MVKRINEQDGKIKEMFTAYSLLLTINEHSMQLNRAIDECRREYKILIDALVNYQKGVIQPQLITPAQILEQVKISEADMPSDLSLPIPTSATYQHLLLRIISTEVFLKGNFLAYVIRLPQTNIQSRSALVSNRTSKDVIPSVSLEYDCCGSEDQNIKLNKLHLHVPLRSVTNSLDHLRIASHKVEDVENLIHEQDLKIKHSTVVSRLSFLSYVGMVTNSLTLICLCYCCCSKCPKFSKWWKDNNPCTMIVVNSKTVKSIHSSRERFRCSGSTASNKTRHSLSGAIEATELVYLDTC